MLRFFPGIVFVQLVTAGLVVAAFKWSHDVQLIFAIVVCALVVSLLAAFWFGSIERDRLNENVAHMREAHQHAVSRMQQDHARQREQILVSAEQEKAAVVSQSYRQISKETQRAHAKANVKVGLAVMGAAGAGAAMLLTQFVTVGVMILLASGGALAGYVARARHEHLARSRQPMLDLEDGMAGQPGVPRVRMLKRD